MWRVRTAIIYILIARLQMDVFVLDTVESSARVDEDAGDLAATGLFSFRREHPESHTAHRFPGELKCNIFYVHVLRGFISRILVCFGECRLELQEWWISSRVDPTCKRDEEL